MFLELAGPGPATGGVGIAFSDRHGGVSTGSFASLNLGRSDVDDVSAVAENHARVRRALGVDGIFTVHQVHGTDVWTVGSAERERWRPGSELGDSVPGGTPLVVADALVTTERGIALCVRVADCLPVLLADPEAGVIAAAHAGRVGLAAGVLVETVASMRRLGAGRIRAWQGPRICGSCYEVPAELQAEVCAGLPAAYATTSWGTPALDLGAAAEHQLRELGCAVERRDPCTRTTPDLFSHRRDGSGAGRQAGLIWMQRD